MTKTAELAQKGQVSKDSSTQPSSGLLESDHPLIAWKQTKEGIAKQPLKTAGKPAEKQRTEVLHKSRERPGRPILQLQKFNSSKASLDHNLEQTMKLQIPQEPKLLQKALVLNAS